MILLQLSAGQGPQECCTAVTLALKALEKECRQYQLKLDIIEQESNKENTGYQSVLLQLTGDKAKQVAACWQGVMLWVCKSPYRGKHKRKNWFFSGQMFEINETSLDRHISFKTCRASGAGGQHVNTTDSAVRATHTASGISVRVQSERSQHANKRLASALIGQKLALLKQEQMSQQEQARWQQHLDLQRGNPVKTFKGEAFIRIE
ncbi:peptide chain release factor H [Thalassomonas viridans]|uniref:Peptide chain release factor H n=1 Tax=Thalassomonas viridans TaxID=137584 RepID=A0AAF0CAP6_9GAMM|nr:peptide chain release factor H [Thalassomonas viridans]WDE06751.1 peptide chain release factor H [Thalassomonas viridans]